jgi:hypothetical protein
MTSFVVPEGEFTFQNLCDANPSVLPLNVLRFITEQITQGKLAKRADANTSMRCYISTPTTPVIDVPKEIGPGVEDLNNSGKIEPE